MKGFIHVSGRFSKTLLPTSLGVSLKTNNVPTCFKTKKLPYIARTTRDESLTKLPKKSYLNTTNYYY